MKNLFITIVSFLITSTAFADVLCWPSGASWGLQFNSGNTPYFQEAYQVLQSGELSAADVEIQQAYMSPSEFKARALFDGQNTHIRAELSSRNGEFAIYTGTIGIEGKLQSVTCSQN